MLDVVRYNRDAWDRQVREENRWTLPVTPEAVQRAREGRVELLLTPTRIVPREWYGEIDSSDLLCLASGGGQQAPILAAAGSSMRGSRLPASSRTAIRASSRRDTAPCSSRRGR